MIIRFNIKYIYLCLIILTIWPSAAQSKDLDKVSLQFKWRSSFQFAGYIAAKEKGFYADEGLDVELRELKPGFLSYVDPVLTGEADFGTADVGILQRFLKGDPVVWLAQIFQHSAQIFITLKDSGIIDPYTMAGKRVAIDLHNLGNAPLTVMLMETLGNPSEKLKIQPVSFDYGRLIRGEVDATPGYITDQPFRFKEQGVGVNIISPRNYGYDFYGDNLFTSRTQVERHPERVKKMVRASLKGWDYALHHQDEIIDLILAKYNTQNLSREHLRYEAKMTGLLIMNELIQLGYIEPKRIERILETYRRLGFTKARGLPEGLIYSGESPNAGQADRMMNDRHAALGLTVEEKNWLALKHKIRVRVSSWPPYMIKSGGLSGASVDYLRTIAEYVGLNVEFKPDILGYTEAMKDVRTERKEYDLLLAMTRSPERMREFAFTNPYLHTPQVIIGRKDSTGLAQMADLTGKTLAIEKGFLIKQVIADHNPTIKFLEVDNTLAALKAVATNQVDAYVGILSTAAYLIQTQGLTNLKVVAATPFKDREICMAMRKDWDPLATIIDKAIEALPPDRLLKIRDKWMSLERVADPTIILTESEKSYLNRKGVVKMCVDPDWVPFERIDEQGRYVGLLADFIDLLSKRLGVPFQLIPTRDYSQSKDYFNRGVCDIIPGEVRRPGLPESILTTKPYYVAPRVFAVHIDAPLITDFGKIAGGKIGTLANSPGLKILSEIYPGIKPIEINTTDEGLRLVESRELDAFVSPLATISYSIKKQGLSSVKIGGVIARDIPFVVMVNKSDRKLVAVLDKAIDSISANERRAISDKWISVTYERGIDYNLIIQVSGALCLVILFLFWRSRVISRANGALLEAQNLLREKNIELETLSMTDALTGLYNRRAMEPLVEKEMGRKKRHGHPVSLMIMDIDHFKWVNDAHGHTAGDDVLAGLSRGVTSILRTTDIMARWGGEEFAILAAETDLSQGLVLAEKVRRHVEELVFDKVGRVTVSIGLAEYSAAESFLDWYRRADEALYLAKETGRNRVETGRIARDDQTSPIGRSIFLRLVWRDEFRCGQETIDRQHRDIFEKANGLIDAFFLEAEPDEIARRLEDFQAAVTEHFRSEEEVLEKTDYPNLADHRREHRSLAARSRRLIADSRAGRLEFKGVIGFLTQEVAANHLFYWDKEFYPWV